MSVKQTLHEDPAEHSYQFSCRAADWSKSAFSSVPMQFEPLELHVVDALRSDCDRVVLEMILLSVLGHPQS